MSGTSRRFRQEGAISRLHCLSLLVTLLLFQLHAHAYCPSHSQGMRFPDHGHAKKERSRWCRRFSLQLSPSSSLASCQHKRNSAPLSRQFSSETDDSEETEILTSNVSSKVFYDRTLMPRPGRNARGVDESDLLSYVSWEEAVIARPYDGGSTAQLDPKISMKDISIFSLVSVGVSMFFAVLVSASGPGAWRYYLAGGLCAAISHSIPVPIDVVKTRKQVDPSLANKDFLAAMLFMIEQEGPRSLLAGLGPTTFGYLIEGSIKFGVYEATKPFIKRLLVVAAGLSSSFAFLNSNVLNLILCGATSGFVAAIALCPMEALRIRLVAQRETNSNWLKTGLHMAKNEGATSLSRGMVPMVLKQVPYTILKNVSFDLSTGSAYSYMRNQGLAISSANKIIITVMSAALASVLCCIGSQPGDMLLSVMNAQEGERRRTRDIIRDIRRSDKGIRGFFVGIKTRFLHVGIIVTLQLFIYDVVKQLCGIAATGSV
jgi:solute carrier family 25 phosphate transporter 3